MVYGVTSVVAHTAATSQEICMKCPFCGYEQDKVVDSRTSHEGRAVRRRRECLECAKRFTTYEYVESTPLTIVKNDLRREPFDRQKLLSGLLAACKKRPISMRQIESIANAIEEDLSKLSKTEISSVEVGKLVMTELAKIDHVAYVRFASVYRNFKDAGEFISEIEDLTARSSISAKVKR
jgi:transcriptional repressor NrdR